MSACWLLILIQWFENVLLYPFYLNIYASQHHHNNYHYKQDSFLLHSRKIFKGV